MKNYRIQDCCLICKYAYDEGSYEYPNISCNVNQDRPEKPDAFAILDASPEKVQKITEQHERWAHWYESHNLDIQGICDLFEPE